MRTARSAHGHKRGLPEFALEPLTAFLALAFALRIRGKTLVAVRAEHIPFIINRKQLKAHFISGCLALADLAPQLFADHKRVFAAFTFAGASVPCLQDSIAVRTVESVAAVLRGPVRRHYPVAAPADDQSSRRGRQVLIALGTAYLMVAVDEGLDRFSGFIGRLARYEQLVSLAGAGAGLAEDRTEDSPSADCALDLTGQSGLDRLSALSAGLGFRLDLAVRLSAVGALDAAFIIQEGGSVFRLDDLAALRAFIFLGRYVGLIYAVAAGRADQEVVVFASLDYCRTGQTPKIRTGIAGVGYFVFLTLAVFSGRLVSVGGGSRAGDHHIAGQALVARKALAGLVADYFVPASRPVATIFPDRSVPPGMLDDWDPAQFAALFAVVLSGHRRSPSVSLLKWHN